MTLQDLAGSTEESLKNLKDLFEALSTGSSTIDRLSANLDNIDQTWTEGVDRLRSGAKEFEGILESSMDDLEGSLEEQTGRTQDLGSQTEAASGTLESQAQSLESSSTDLLSDLEQSQADVGADGEALSHGVTDLTRQANEAHESCAQHRQEIEDVTEKVTASLSSVHEKLGELKGRLEWSLDSLITAYESEKGSTVKDRFDAYQKHIDPGLRAGMESVVSAGSSGAEQALAEFDGEVATQGASLSASCTESLEQVQRACESEFMQQIEGAFREAADSAVKALAREMVEQVADMTIGVEVTAAISPYIPEIVLVKNGLEAGNAVAGAIGLG